MQLVGALDMQHALAVTLLRSYSHTDCLHLYKLYSTRPNNQSPPELLERHSHTCKNCRLRQHPTRRGTEPLVPVHRVNFQLIKTNYTKFDTARAHYHECALCHRATKQAN